MSEDYPTLNWLASRYDIKVLSTDQMMQTMAAAIIGTFVELQLNSPSEDELIESAVKRILGEAPKKTEIIGLPKVRKIKGEDSAQYWGNKNQTYKKHRKMRKAIVRYK